ncbi:hypothetical protein E4U43_003468 [Claviceps pusilla]|uniref:Uncharacterized protein n=1 Tax=Claviceps pusilla TaxID=123648 RepID=A0A9P7N4P1_9HYPO|nr:hypothetical protein E4U43_003468 [Claviceps pusilla]
MRFSIPITLAAALLTGQTAAECGEDFPPDSGDKTPHLIGTCSETWIGIISGKPARHMKCGQQDNAVLISPARILLNVSPAGRIIRVNCGAPQLPSDARYYHCSANDAGQFPNPCTGDIQAIVIEDLVMA